MLKLQNVWLRPFFPKLLIKLSSVVELASVKITQLAPESQ